MQSVQGIRVADMALQGARRWTPWPRDRAKVLERFKLGDVAFLDSPAPRALRCC